MNANAQNEDRIHPMKNRSCGIIGMKEAEEQMDVPPRKFASLQSQCERNR